MPDDMTAVQQAAKLVRASQRAYTRKWAFLGLAFLAFLVTILVLARLDLLPDAPAAVAADPSAISLDASPSVVATSSTALAVPEEPIQISIPTINLSATISNPDTTDINVLDNGLLTGAVRYPTSAELGQVGNVILFGHSSYLPIVNNKAYKTFDGIQNLKNGDRITVSSGTTAYVYAVTDVQKESAASQDGIALTSTGHTLTLATCNSFGVKTDRFVVSADFVESYSIVP